VRSILPVRKPEEHPAVPGDLIGKRNHISSTILAQWKPA
jgi:hypothetical protein